MISIVCCSIFRFLPVQEWSAPVHLSIGDVGLMQYVFLGITLIGVIALLFVSLVALASVMGWPSLNRPRIRPRYFSLRLASVPAWLEWSRRRSACSSWKLQIRPGRRSRFPLSIANCGKRTWINVRDIGAGGPALVFIHYLGERPNVGSGCRTVAEQLELWAKRCTILDGAQGSERPLLAQTGRSRAYGCQIMGRRRRAKPFRRSFEFGVTSLGQIVHSEADYWDRRSPDLRRSHGHRWADILGKNCPHEFANTRARSGISSHARRGITCRSRNASRSALRPWLRRPVAGWFSQPRGYRVNSQSGRNRASSVSAPPWPPGNRHHRLWPRAASPDPQADRRAPAGEGSRSRMRKPLFAAAVLPASPVPPARKRHCASAIRRETPGLCHGSRRRSRGRTLHARKSSPQRRRCWKRWARVRSRPAGWRCPRSLLRPRQRSPVKAIAAIRQSREGSAFWRLRHRRWIKRKPTASRSSRSCRSRESRSASASGSASCCWSCWLPSITCFS